MLIALLAVLGVDLIVIVLFVAIVLGRRRWLSRQPGEFAGEVRLTTGEVHGLTTKWKRGSGRWVRDVLVWSRAPFRFRDELVPVDHLLEQRNAHPGEVKRLGDEPIVIAFVSDGAVLAVAVKPEHVSLATGPFTQHGSDEHRDAHV